MRSWVFEGTVADGKQDEWINLSYAQLALISILISLDIDDIGHIQMTNL